MSVVFSAGYINDFINKLNPEQLPENSEEKNYAEIILGILAKFEQKSIIQKIKNFEKVRLKSKANNDQDTDYQGFLNNLKAFKKFYFRFYGIKGKFNVKEENDLNEIKNYYGEITGSNSTLKSLQYSAGTSSEGTNRLNSLATLKCVLEIQVGCNSSGNILLKTRKDIAWKILFERIFKLFEPVCCEIIEGYISDNSQVLSEEEYTKVSYNLFNETIQSIVPKNITLSEQNITDLITNYKDKLKQKFNEDSFKKKIEEIATNAENSTAFWMAVGILIGRFVLTIVGEIWQSSKDGNGFTCNKMVSILGNALLQAVKSTLVWTATSPLFSKVGPIAGTFLLILGYQGAKIVADWIRCKCMIDIDNIEFEPSDIPGSVDSVEV